VVSLGQKLVQLTVPGVPDVYQGAEFELLTLVDPDNRRAVDFEARRVALDKLDAGTAPADLSQEKLLVTSRALRLRRDQPGWFGPGGRYRPMRAHGPAADHLIAFERGPGAITLATRLPVALGRAGGWHDTLLTLPPGDWTDVLTGTRMSGGDVLVADLLAQYPVALLSSG
jgi:(1->4)-alpha-D-glucan 1-alpha-D-glucosylmutase